MRKTYRVSVWEQRWQEGREANELVDGEEGDDVGAQVSAEAACVGRCFFGGWYVCVCMHICM